MNLHLTDIFSAVKSDLCSLVDFKLRGDTIEIITGIPTITSSHVSVFVSYRDGEYIISDGGWVNGGEYDNEISDDDIYSRILAQLIDHFRMKDTRSANNTVYYYKKAPKLELVSAMVSDVGHFVSATINAQVLEYGDVSERKIRRVFHSQMNSFLRTSLGNERVETNYDLVLNDKHTIRFNAVVHANRAKNYYIMYITGSNQSNFIKDISKAAINFELLGDQVANLNYTNRIALVNVSAPGYSPDDARAYLDKLSDVLNDPPILVSSEGKFDIRQISGVLQNN